MTPRQTLDNIFPPPMAPSDSTLRTQMSRSRSLKSRQSSLASLASSVYPSRTNTPSSEGQGPARSMTPSSVSAISTIGSDLIGSRSSSFSSSTIEGHPSPALSTTPTLSVASTVSDLATIRGSPSMGSISSASFAVEPAPYNLGSSGDKLDASTIWMLQNPDPTIGPADESPRYTTLNALELDIIKFTPRYYDLLSQYITDEPTGWSCPAQADQPGPLPYFDFRTATFEDTLEEKNLFAEFLLGHLFPEDLGVYSFPMFEEVWPITRVIYNLNFENRKIGFKWWLFDNEETYAARGEILDADDRVEGGVVQFRKWIGTMLFLHGEDLGRAHRFC
ncbi:uncharacterized protein STEHIDRAFT_157734 [Stereum hirsutum FP-91666 SS1]|uniref:uncharacterized protein n=1 Tax=Stereum hirsutum (strain FP-91666) TaxID=721885 RepID=UPI00044493A6|nr:uncharacterized protein STEHIDRAFT_157734 [Stereum hirsutum FP-91666 SS1]EIM86231.1 hypothetical protein STEHIDRAFT_157734 [Stereum hirsutum FP-91666 SS1]